MNVTTIGIDLAKSVFQLHGVDAAGTVVFRKKLRRSAVLAFLRDLPSCLIGLEACATSHFWAREIGALGHEVRLIPPAYVKPYVKRQKNDAADAEAICEAVTRPNMRFVPVKSEARQSVLMLHRTRDLLMRQRTMMLNAVRAHLAEFGIITAQGPHKILALIRAIQAGEVAGLPEIARAALESLALQLDNLGGEIRNLERQLMVLAPRKRNQSASRDHTRCRHHHRNSPGCQYSRSGHLQDRVASSRPFWDWFRARTHPAARIAWAGYRRMGNGYLPPASGPRRHLGGAASRRRHIGDGGLGARSP